MAPTKLPTSPMRRVRRAGASVAAVASLALVAACGSSGSASDSGGSGESVAAGADKADYIAALESMDPVELKVQVITPKGTPYAKVWESYGKLLDEWSGGKITTKMYYSGSITTAGISQAMSDGLIDMGPVQPATEPDDFPYFAYLGGYSFLNHNDPVAGTVQGFGSMLENGYSDEMFAEYDKAGLVPLMPVAGPGAPGILCGDGSVTSLADAQGKSIMANTPSAKREVEAIGGTPVSLPFTEIVEGLQRGTIDCTLSTLGAAGPWSLHDVTSDWTLPSGRGFASAREASAISKKVWDDLPLAGRQLIWDTLPQLIDYYMQYQVLETQQGALIDADKAGVKIHDLDSDASEALDKVHATMTKEAAKSAPKGVDADATLAELEKVNQRWADLVAETDYPTDLTWDKYIAWTKDHEVDTQPVLDGLAETLESRRPE